MRFTDILYAKADNIARITINRPEVYNAIRGKTTDEMVVALQDAAEDESMRVVVIAGSGPNAFCSTFGQTGPRVGSPAAGFGVGYLATVIGQKKAREMWMLTQRYTGQQAADMGLANSVVPHDQLEAEVLRYCNIIKNNSPVILQLEKITFNENTEYMEKIPSPTTRYAPNYIETDEAEERRLAFIERRPINPDKNLPTIKR